MWDFISDLVKVKETNSKGIKEVDGDLIQLGNEGEVDLIIHGCNCFCAMAGGIAYSIAKEFPEAEVRDFETDKGDKSKLGTITYVEIGGLTVVNLYSQFLPGADVSYDAIASGLQIVKQKFPNKKIGIPQIGAGIAGGNWNIIKKIIEKELKGCDVTIVYFKP